MTTKSLDAGRDSLDMFATRGHVPGYLGHVPGMRNHVVGKRFSEATLRASDCSDQLRRGINPSGGKELIDRRPQGRDFLYAQVATSGVVDSPVLAPPHVGKRKPLLNGKATGEIDPRLMCKAVGGNDPERQMRIIKGASLPVLTYSNKRFIDRKEHPEEFPDSLSQHVNCAKVPGYTGHQAGSQHMYGKPYGHITHDLNNTSHDPTYRALSFINYSENRPLGCNNPDQVDKIPGYQGHVPAKDNNIYGKTFGDATKLASKAVAMLDEGKTPSTLHELVDDRPQGRVDLYAESHIRNRADPGQKETLFMHLGKGVVQPKFQETTEDYKIRQVVYDDAKQVKQARHQIVGYTGHIHGEQHVYAEGYGKMTRILGDLGHADPNTKDNLLYWEDSRPQRSGTCM